MLSHHSSKRFNLKYRYVEALTLCISCVLEWPRVLFYREGSSGRGCSSWWLPTVRTLWRNVPERPSASCPMCRQRSQSSAPWKESAQPPPQVSAAPAYRQIDWRLRIHTDKMSEWSIKAQGYCLLNKCTVLTLLDWAVGTSCSMFK